MEKALYLTLAIETLLQNTASNSSQDVHSEEDLGLPQHPRWRAL